MLAKSILFSDPEISHKGLLHEVPEYFKDLNLDQIIDSVVGKLEYLKPFSILHFRI